MTLTSTATAGGGPTYAHAEHEARHIVAAWFVGGVRVDSASVGIHAAQEGAVRITPLSQKPGEDGVRELIGRLCGWLGDPDLPSSATWPEPYPPRLDAPDGVGVIIKWLGLSREQYEAACEIACELVEEPRFKEAVALVARALMLAPSIDHEGLEILREAAGFAKAEGEILWAS